jgi:hypothetical protein
MNYLDEVADRIRARLPPGVLPDRDTTSLLRIYAVLALSLGFQVQLGRTSVIEWFERLRAAIPVVSDKEPR